MYSVPRDRIPGWYFVDDSWSFIIVPCDSRHRYVYMTLPGILFSFQEINYHTSYSMPVLIAESATHRVNNSNSIKNLQSKLLISWFYVVTVILPQTDIIAAETLRSKMKYQPDTSLALKNATKQFSHRVARHVPMNTYFNIENDRNYNVRDTLRTKKLSDNLFSFRTFSFWPFQSNTFS